MSNENKVRCQDCGHEYPEWFMIEVLHGGVFGEGSTVSCAGCQHNEPRPAPWESEEVYCRRVTPFVNHPDVGLLTVSNLATKWRRRAKEWLLRLEEYAPVALDWARDAAARIADRWVREKLEEPTAEQAAEGAKIVDALFMPQCRDCDQEASWLRTDGKLWWFMCNTCDNARMGEGESYPLEDAPSLMSELEHTAKKLRRKLQAAKTKLITAEMIVGQLGPCSVDGCKAPALLFGKVDGEWRYMCADHAVPNIRAHHICALLAALEAMEDTAAAAICRHIGSWQRVVSLLERFRASPADFGPAVDQALAIGQEMLAEADKAYASSHATAAQRPEDCDSRLVYSQKRRDETKSKTFDAVRSAENEHGYQQNPSFTQVHWFTDPAADGMRERAWVLSASGESAELCAYHRGRWCVGLPERQYQWVVEGVAPDFETAKRATYNTWQELAAVKEAK